MKRIWRMGYCKGYGLMLGLLAVICGVCLPLNPAAASAYQDWTGVWMTNFGKMKLEQNGRMVYGNWGADRGTNGQLEGQLTDEWGFYLQGKCQEEGKSGGFQVKIIESNESFSGWLYTQDDFWFGRRLHVEDAAARQQWLDVLNNSPYHVTAMFICPAGSEEWREVLGGRELRSGQQRKVIFLLDDSVERWDVKIVNSNGDFAVFSGQSIKKDHTSIHYYYRDGSGAIQFGVG
ncbi:MAG TPA: hypothetical protein VN611_18290 [Patescibacteria group bacterium]|nr:hypothetical protein [Patescibacteria group bacterium]